MVDLRGEQDLDREGFKKVEQFCNFLEQMTMLEPAKRITCTDALKHPFIIEK